MPKFILIDQSIKDLSGHHYEYAVRVLNAAERAGYEPVLATHRDCIGLDTTDWRVIPAFRLGFWEMPLGVGVRTGLGQRLSKLRGDLAIRAKYSRLGLIWAYRKRGIGFDRAVVGLSTRWVPVLALLAVCLGVVKASRFLWSQFGPLRGVLAWVWRALIAIVKVGIMIALLPLWPVGWLWTKREKLIETSRERLKAKYFGEDTAAVFRDIDVEDGDAVFIPTIADIEMVGLGPLFERDERTRRADWHLLYRRNLYTGREPDYARQEGSLRPVRNAFQKVLSKLSAEHHVYFWTDTEQLTDQWNRLGAAEFRTLPIPVDKAYAEPRLGKPGSPLNVVYAGDARQEKGYQLLPRLVGDVWRDQIETGRVRFVFQSNLSGGVGDPPSRVARAQLDGLAAGVDGSKLTLIPDPLDCDAYRELVVSGDAVLVLYDRDNYYARSSGIFAEAMVSGLPVVVPCGSWMAVHLSEPIAEAHDHLIDDAQRVEDVNVTTLPWSILQALEQNPFSKATDELNLAGDRPRFSWIDVPPGATEFRFTARQSPGSTGRFCRVWVAQLDEDKHTVEESGQILGGLGGGRFSMILRIEPGTRRLWFGVSGAYSHDPIQLSDIAMGFVHSDVPLPRSAVGIVYDQPGEISAALRELAAHPDHYRQTAGRFAERWGAWHNPDTLVDLLKHAGTPGRENAPTAPPRSRPARKAEVVVNGSANIQQLTGAQR